LSLNKKNTEYISVIGKEIVPKNLSQTYIECELYEKIDILFSFIKTHLKAKVIVFCSSQKQVSFLSTAFHQLALGTSIHKLSGNMSQNVRRENYENFLSKFLLSF
jgi:ATP-dependent RNA helicase DDX10/DBP4